MTPPLVSVLVPLYNKAPWVMSTINSVLEQTHEELELVIIDDGSADNSRAIVETVTDRRVRFWSRQNRGANATRNELLDAARGRYIQFLDADDLLLPLKLEKQVAALKSGASVSISQVWIDRVSGPVQPTILSGSLEEIVIWHGVHTAGPLHRRDTLEAIGGWTEALAASQEYDLHLRLFLNGHWDNAEFIDDALAIWRSVPNSTTSDELRVYRSKVEALGAWTENPPPLAKEVIARTLANAARHLARCGEFTNAGDALRTAMEIDPRSIDQYPARIRWVPTSAGLQPAEWLDHKLRTLLRRGATDG